MLENPIAQNILNILSDSLLNDQEKSGKLQEIFSQSPSISADTLNDPFFIKARSEVSISQMTTRYSDLANFFKAYKDKYATLLTLAISLKLNACVRILLEHGADAHQTNRLISFSSFQMAVQNNFIECVYLILATNAKLKLHHYVENDTGHVVKTYTTLTEQFKKTLDYLKEKKINQKSRSTQRGEHLYALFKRYQKHIGSAKELFQQDSQAINLPQEIKTHADLFDHSSRTNGYYALFTKLFILLDTAPKRLSAIFIKQAIKEIDEWLQPSSKAKPAWAETPETFAENLDRTNLDSIARVPCSIILG